MNCTYVSAIGAFVLFGCCGPLVAQERKGLVSISRVEIMVRDNVSDEEYASKGVLFRLKGKEERERVATIDSFGVLDKSVKCRSGEMFQADTGAWINSPQDPFDNVCAPKMKFRFKRNIVFSSASEEGFGAVVAGSPDVPINQYAYYAQKFRDAGALETADALESQAIASAAKLLGDESLDRFVFRQGGRLIWNSAGRVALKSHLQDKNALIDAKVREVMTAQIEKKDAWTIYAEPSGVASNKLFACSATKGTYLCGKPGDMASIPLGSRGGGGGDLIKPGIFRAFD